MAQRRANKQDPNAKHIGAPTTPLGANNLEEVWGRDKGDVSRRDTIAYHFMSFSGVRSSYTTWSEILLLFLMETAAAMIITAAVGIGSWFQGTNAAVNALMIAFFYAIGYYLATRLPCPDAMPIHGNGVLTVASMITRDVGLWGFLLYTTAQYVGMLLGGGLFLSLLFSGVPGGTGITLNDACLGVTMPNTVVHSLVPIPITTGALPSSLATVIVLELLFGIGFGLVVMVKTYLNTATNDNASYAKNFKKGTKLGAVAIFIFVLVGYQFSVWTFSNVAWGGPAFGGLGWVQSCDLTRQTNQIVNLSNGIFTDSVFASGLAAMLYLLMPWADGIVTGFIAVGLMWLAFRKREDESRLDYAYMHNKVGSESPSPLSIATSVQSTNPSLRTMLMDPKTGAPM
jgi:hypothetical protein